MYEMCDALRCVCEPFLLGMSTEPLDATPWIASASYCLRQQRSLLTEMLLTNFE